MITNTQYSPCVCGTGEKGTEERLPKHLIHTHYHSHRGSPGFHQHEHTHSEEGYSFTPGDFDHHSVTKAKERKDV